MMDGDNLRETHSHIVIASWSGVIFLVFNFFCLLFVVFAAVLSVFVWKGEREGGGRRIFCVVLLSNYR